MSRFVGFGLVMLLLASAPAMAADENVDPKPIAMAMVAAFETDAAIRVAPGVLTPSTIISGGERRFDRPSALRPLYAASVTLQAWDTYSTIDGIGRGAAEMNPLMNLVVKNPAAFI